MISQPMEKVQVRVNLSSLKPLNFLKQGSFNIEQLYPCLQVFKKNLSTTVPISFLLT